MKHFLVLERQAFINDSLDLETNTRWWASVPLLGSSPSTSTSSSSHSLPLPNQTREGRLKTPEWKCMNDVARIRNGLNIRRLNQNLNIYKTNTSNRVFHDLTATV